MKRLPSALLALWFVAVAAAEDQPNQPPRKPSLSEARRGFKTKLVRKTANRTPADRTPADKPPASLFRLVRFDSPAGKLAAYVSRPPQDGRRRPAIIWIVGGFSNSIGATAWAKMPADNDQSASAFRKAGIVMMYPSLRGGNDNPGVKEGFFGEVDDVRAAADYLAKQDFVDPRRIYLGGHSTGGTLALLAAESTDRFRAVFSFGPVADARDYDPKYLPFDIRDRREGELRAPVRWLHSIRNPVFVLEGTGGNIDALKEMARASRNPLVHFYPVKGANHFSILAPVTRVVADKILRDSGPKVNLNFTEAELNQLFAKRNAAKK